MEFKIEIAGYVFGIKCLYLNSQIFCKDYICEEKKVDCEIRISDSDLQYEEKIIECEARNRTQTTRIPLKPELEKSAIYRKIIFFLIEQNVFLMHGSVVGINNECFMIAGPSGIGKTTRTRLFLEVFPEAYVINGDKPLIKVCDNTVYACGTPWCGKEHWNTNIMVPLKGIFFLERAEANRITELTFGEVLTPLLQQTYFYSEDNHSKRLIQLIGKLCKNTKLYRLESNLNVEIVHKIYNTIFLK